MATPTRTTAAESLREKIIRDVRELHYRYGRSQREIARAAGWATSCTTVHKIIAGHKKDLTMTQAADLERGIARIRAELARLA